MNHQKELKRLKALNLKLLHALQDARDMIAVWHGEEAWPKIREGRKMKRINAIIAEASKEWKAS